MNWNSYYEDVKPKNKSIYQLKLKETLAITQCGTFEEEEYNTVDNTEEYAFMIAFSK